MIGGLRPTAGKLEGSRLGPWVANGQIWPPWFGHPLDGH